MKKTHILLSGLLIVAMLITSAGLLYASLYASGGGVQSMLNPSVFDKETGIRYNNLTNEFEVFNEAGISWIASGRYISIDGIVENESVTENPNPETHGLADGDKTYSLMRDIAYTGQLPAIDALGNDIYNSSFDIGKITLEKNGVIDGRGFYIKGFQVVAQNLSDRAIGTSLVAINRGTIRNLNVSNIDISLSLGAKDAFLLFNNSAAGMLVGMNNGTILNCRIYGDSVNNSYTSSTYQGLYGIAASNSGAIINCINNANIENPAMTTVFVAGITSARDNAKLLNNINNGNISATNYGYAAGIIIDYLGTVFSVSGNKNNGNIYGNASASGIVDGGVSLDYLTAKGNANNGNVDGSLSFAFYYGVEDSATPIVPSVPQYGLRWNGQLNESNGGFEIYSVDGISWIGSGEYFDENGYRRGEYLAAPNAYYEIQEGIETLNYADRTGQFNFAFNGDNAHILSAPSLLNGGTLEGNGCLLSDFPARRCSPTSNNYSALFEDIAGTIQNLSLRVTVVVLDGLAVASSGSYVGSFGAIAYNTAKLINCSVFGGIEIDSSTASGVYLGGIIGYARLEAKASSSPERSVGVLSEVPEVPEGPGGGTGGGSTTEPEGPGSGSGGTGGGSTDPGGSGGSGGGDNPGGGGTPPPTKKNTPLITDPIIEGGFYNTNGYVGGVVGACEAFSTPTSIISRYTGGIFNGFVYGQYAGGFAGLGNGTPPSTFKTLSTGQIWAGVLVGHVAGQTGNSFSFSPGVSTNYAALINGAQAPTKYFKSPA